MVLLNLMFMALVFSLPVNAKKRVAPNDDPNNNNNSKEVMLVEVKVRENDGIEEKRPDNHSPEIVWKEPLTCFIYMLSKI